MAISTAPTAKSGRRWEVWVAVLGLGLAFAVLAGRLTGDAVTSSIRQAAAQRLNSYATGLENLLARYDFMPRTLELNKDVIALLQHPDDDKLRAEVNRYLEQLNLQAGSDTLYIVNLSGVTQASSNGRIPGSLASDKVAFRPYVREALRGQPGSFYGAGTTSGEPGYFVAHGIYHDGQMLGVAMVKVDIEQLEQGWARGADRVLLADADGVVFLSSVREWKYCTLAPLTPAAQKELDVSRQYLSHALKPLGLTELRRLDDGAAIVRVPGSAEPMLSQRHALPARQWQFVYLSDLGAARASADNAFVCALLLEVAALLLVLFLRRRAHAAPRAIYDPAGEPPR